MRRLYLRRIARALPGAARAARGRRVGQVDQDAPPRKLREVSQARGGLALRRPLRARLDSRQICSRGTLLKAFLILVLHSTCTYLVNYTLYNWLQHSYEYIRAHFIRMRAHNLAHGALA